MLSFSYLAKGQTVKDASLQVALQWVNEGRNVIVSNKVHKPTEYNLIKDGKVEKLTISPNVSQSEWQKLMNLARRGFELENASRNNIVVKKLKVPIVSYTFRPKPVQQYDHKTLLNMHVNPNLIATDPKKLKQLFKKPSKLIGSDIRVRHDMKPLQKLAQQFREVGKDPTITYLYHGTRLTNINSIIENGFQVPMRSGMLGKGIYLGKKEKARNFSSGGYILRVAVLLGNCKKVTKVEDIDRMDNEIYDSLFMERGKYPSVFKGYLLNSEWIVRNPEQCVVVALTPISNGRMW